MNWSNNFFKIIQNLEQLVMNNIIINKRLNGIGIISNYSGVINRANNSS